VDDPLRTTSGRFVSPSKEVWESVPESSTCKVYNNPLLSIRQAAAREVFELEGHFTAYLESCSKLEELRENLSNSHSESR
jgi:hypothetical protein